MTDADRPIEVRVPATSANLGPGFDALGLALDWYDTYTFEVAATPSVTVEGEAEGEAPTDEKNLALAAALHLAGVAGFEFRHLRVREESRIPVARGLGSSAAAVVAGLVAANQAAGGACTTSQLIEEAIQLEGHPDNVLPALVGGLVVIAGDSSPTRWVKVPFPDELQIAVAVPERRIETSHARSVIPRQVELKDAVFNLSRVGLFVAALQSKQFSLLEEAMRDRLHQPYRAPLHPALSEMIGAAIDAGAAGAALSGSGSSVIAFAERDVRAVGDAMRAACEAKGIACRSYTAGVCQNGIEVRRV